jgi:hypothetical protein
LNDRYQCSRSKLGLGPITVRVIFNGDGPHTEEKRPGSEDCSYNNNCNVASRQKLSEKKKRAKDVLTTLESSKKAKQASEVQSFILLERKSERARQIIMRLSSSKVMKEVETMQLLTDKNLELESRLTRKQAQLDIMSTKVHDMMEKIKQASATLADYNKQLKSKKLLVKYYNSKSSIDIKTAPDELVTLCSSIEKAFTCLKGKHCSTKAKMLVECLMSGKILQGEAAKAVNDVMRQYIRSLFRPWKLVKAGDVCSVGGFKTTTINALRTIVDENGEGFFPSPTTVNRSRALLDDYGAGLVGYVQRETKYGEVYFLNFERAFRLLLKACNIHDLAQTSSVKVALTVDGADLFKGRTHVSTGIKITDERAVHPISKQPFLVVDREEGEDMFVKVQTREVCCIMIIADAKDNKHLYEDVFKEYYEWGEKLRLEGLAESALGPKLLPFQVTHTTDLKAAWFLSSRGGGCKNKTHFCHLCTCTKDTLTCFTIENFRCKRCKQQNRLKCYHKQVCDNVYVHDMLEGLNAELGRYYEQHGKTYHSILSTTKLRVDHMQVDRETDLNHIDYVIPVNDVEKQRLYTQFIARECHLRGIRLHGTQVEEWRSLLRSAVVLEKYIDALEKVRIWHAEGREIVPLVEVVELLIPCILHLENRVGEKMITIILRKALDDFCGRKEQFAEQMNTTFQTKVLGSEDSPSQWKIPFVKDPEGNRKIDHIQVRNNVARCIMGEMDTIIEDAWPSQNTELQRDLIRAVSKYRAAMQILTRHSEHSDDDIEEFQTLIDDFFAQWVDIFGHEGITNYIHMLGSGHIMYFMKKYGCLYLYSQQGWEALNNTIQAFIYQNSQRGGFGSGEGKKKSYIFPLVRMVIRDLLWKTYEADAFFIHLEEQGKAC